MLRHRFFLVQSGEIYGGCAGFYDYGPNGTKLKNNIISQWRKIFINGNENVLELESSLLTPKKVFEASGHLQKFSDFMVKGKSETKIILQVHGQRRETGWRPGYRWQLVALEKSRLTEKPGRETECW